MLTLRPMAGHVMMYSSIRSAADILLDAATTIIGRKPNALHSANQIADMQRAERCVGLQPCISHTRNPSNRVGVSVMLAVDMTCLPLGFICLLRMHMQWHTSDQFVLTTFLKNSFCPVWQFPFRLLHNPLALEGYQNKYRENLQPVTGIPNPQTLKLERNSK